MKNLLVVITAAIFMATTFHMPAQAANAETRRTAQAKALFDANRIKSGRIVVLIKEPGNVKGEEIAGVKGFKKLNKKRWQKEDFAGVRKLAVFEKHKDGSITTRDATMVKDGRIIFADSGNRKKTAKKPKSAIVGLRTSASAKREASPEQDQSVMISGEDYVAAEEEPVQVVQEDIVVDTNQADESADVVYSEKVKKYREQKAQEQTETEEVANAEINFGEVDLVVNGGEEEASDWEPIEIEGERACLDASSGETWFSTLSGTQSGCEEDENESGLASCAAKYPATTSSTAGFLHGLTGDCYSCPNGYLRSLNPDIKAADACTKVIQASSKYEKATFKGPVTTAKPHKKAFKDPRNGGEWWKCPKDRPRRTLEKVTSNKACATKEIIGEKLSKAEFLGAVNNPKPAGAFADPRNGGEYWKCPKGYNRSLTAVTEWDACVITTPRSVDEKKATFRGKL